MVQGQLSPNGISEENVLNAFLTIDRAAYLEKHHLASAYVDQNIVSEAGDVIMIKPLVAAHIIQYLVKRYKSGRIAVIGTGTQYEMSLLEKLGFDPVHVNDEISLEANAPYKAIAIFGAVETKPYYFLDFLYDEQGVVCAIVKSDNAVTGDVIVLSVDKKATQIAQAGAPYIRSLKPPEGFSF